MKTVVLTLGLLVVALFAPGCCARGYYSTGPYYAPAPAYYAPPPPPAYYAPAPRYYAPPPPPRHYYRRGWW